MSDPVNVTELGSSEFKEFLDSFDHVFSDCDGVIWIEDALPGSGEFFKKMKEHGKTVHYVSNNSLRTKQNYVQTFKAAGIDDGYENLTIPSTAIAEYLKSVNFDKKVYCITCPETFKVLQSNGFKCVQGPDFGSDFYQEFSQYLDDDPEVGAVVCDCDFNVNLIKMHKAIMYLRRPDVLFITGATDRYALVKPGCLALGTGPFTDIIIEESKRVPISMGKPGKTFGEFAMSRAGVTNPSRVLFIGDTIATDVGLGKNTGFKTLLVLNNATKEDMMAHKTLKPDYYADSLESIVPLL
ncbi:hypothetical protein ABMA28_002551 [Loxostege sticticalis]|uniref:4-nitrophenylphosphatase n=1 Tax=Loxostege sticticalis TaxID=481309 RepID=A0ABD0SZX0_LOXSC